MASPQDLVTLSGTGKTEDIIKVLKMRCDMHQNFVSILLNLHLNSLTLVTLVRHGLEILLFGLELKKIIILFLILSTITVKLILLTLNLNNALHIHIL